MKTYIKKKLNYLNTPFVRMQLLALALIWTLSMIAAVIIEGLGK